MREIVVVRIKYDRAFGEDIGSPTYKNALPYKVAESLEDSMIDGWQHMRPYHLRSHDFKMFKSLCDLCRDEIKALISKQKNKKPDESFIRESGRITR